MNNKQLKLSADLSLPLAAGTETIAVLGRRGSGKSNTATVLIEELLDAGQQVVSIDPKGEGWGLKAKGAGGPGYPVIVFGEPQGDLPLREEHGEMLADFVVSSGRSIVLSLAGFSSDAAERRLVQAFCERLYRQKMRPGGHSPLMVVLEEAHLFVPQRVDASQTGVVRAIQRLVRQGRSAGIGMMLVDQRPASVNKDVLTQLGVMVAHQLSSPQDRAAVEAWVEAQDADGKAVECMDTLAALKPGEAWVWSPAANLFQRTHIRRRRTFDSGSTPTLGEKAATAKVEMAAVDLDHLRTQLESVVKEREANDPAALKKRIAELEKTAKTASATVTEKPAVDPALIAQAERLIERLNGVITHTARSIEELQERQREAQQNADALVGVTRSIETALRQVKSPAGRPAASVPPAARLPAVPRRTTAATVSRPTDSRLNGAQQRLLDAAAWWQSIGVEEPTRAQLGFVARIKPTGGHFSNSIGPLITGGMLEGLPDGRVCLSGSGAAIARNPESRPTLEAYHEGLLEVLATGAQQRLLQVIINAGPDAGLTPEQIGQEAGMNHAGGHFSNSIGPLSTLGLIERRGGVVRPTALLFPEGLS